MNTNDLFIFLHQTGKEDTRTQKNPEDLTKLSQEINGLMQMHPEPERPQGGSLVGDRQGQLKRAAADLLRT